MKKLKLIDDYSDSLLWGLVIKAGTELTVAGRQSKDESDKDLVLVRLPKGIKGHAGLGTLGERAYKRQVYWFIAKSKFEQEEELK